MPLTQQRLSDTRSDAMSVETTQRNKRRTSALPQMQVARVTLPEEIYRRLKTMILDGGLMPGELVTIQGLAGAFGVSAMPVREALQRLTAEGALRVISGRSVGIPELESDRLTDLTKVDTALAKLPCKRSLTAPRWHVKNRSEAPCRSNPPLDCLQTRPDPTVRQIK